MSPYWLSITILHCSVLTFPLSVFVSHCSDREKPAFRYPQCIYIFVQLSNSLSMSNFTVVIASSLSAQPPSLLPWPLDTPTPPWGPPLTAFLSWDRGTQSLQAVLSPSLLSSTHQVPPERCAWQPPAPCPWPSGRLALWVLVPPSRLPVQNTPAIRGRKRKGEKASCLFHFWFWDRFQCLCARTFIGFFTLCLNCYCCW